MPEELFRGRGKETHVCVRVSSDFATALAKMGVKGRDIPPTKYRHRQHHREPWKEGYNANAKLFQHPTR
jgi:hypothetical protein